MNIVVFKIMDREYGVDIPQVKEVIRSRRITPVPDTAEFVEGVIILRGKVIPVINLRKKLGMESKILDKKSRIVIAQVGSHILGMTVDSISDVLRIDREKITVPDEALHEARYLIGLININKRLILLVDMVKLLTGEEVAGVHKVYDRVEVRKRV